MTIQHLLYCTINNINGRVYIGVHSTEDVNDGYMGSGIAIKEAFNKYGKENFTTTVLHTYNSREELLEKEAYIVDADFVKLKWNYNIAIGGGGFGSGENHPMYGRTISDTHRENLSKAKSGVNNPLYGVCGEDNPNYGSTRSETTKSLLRKSKLGSKHTEETKKKLSELGKLRTHTEETKAKMSASKKGKNTGKDNSRWGVLLSDKTKSKMSKSAHSARKVQHIATGEIFYSIKEACKVLNLNYRGQQTALLKGYKTAQFNYI